MNMEDYCCDRVSVSFTFTAKDFKKVAFLRAVNIKDQSKFIDEEGDLMLRFLFAARNEPKKQYAHLRIVVFSDKTGVGILDFHRRGIKAKNNKLPYLEEVGEWLGRFFKPEELPVSINVSYEFNDQFVPIVPLPFPFVATSKDLSGLKVTGLALQYPPDDPIESAIVQIGKPSYKYPYLFVQKKEAPVKLKAFDLYEELGNLQAFVSTLIKKQEKSDADEQESTKA